MTIVKQWKGFSQELIIQCRFPFDFYPFDYPMIDNQVQTVHTGYKNLSYLGVEKIRKHTDSNFYPIYSAFLVVRNDCMIAKGCHQSQYKFEPQYPGTIVVINIQKIHHVIRDRRLKTPAYRSLWIGACVEYEDLPKAQKIEEMFREFITWRLKNGNC